MCVCVSLLVCLLVVVVVVVFFFFFFFLCCVRLRCGRFFVYLRAGLDT